MSNSDQTHTVGIPPFTSPARKAQKQKRENAKKRAQKVPQEGSGARLLRLPPLLLQHRKSSKENVTGKMKERLQKFRSWLYSKCRLIETTTRTREY